MTNGGKTAQIPVGSVLLRGSMRADGGIPFRCCGGICGTCRCFIEEGLENTRPPTKKEGKQHLGRRTRRWDTGWPARPPLPAR